MPSHPLNRDTQLSIAIGAVMSRNEYTQDPAPVIDELYRVAGGRLDLLAAEVGLWVGSNDDQYRARLVAALRTLPLDMDTRSRSAHTGGAAQRTAPAATRALPASATPHSVAAWEPANVKPTQQPTTSY
ncbi:hypothetical protein [Microbacterium sp. NPDC056052]|uniref:hypothetical protein n=1 Tax=Microbacterium sp. NPDC056052 TaxID=3345695 RepID=UPI0035D634F5